MVRKSVMIRVPMDLKIRVDMIYKDEKRMDRFRALVKDLDEIVYSKKK